VSLIEPNIIDTLKRYKTVLVVGGLGLLLVGVALFLYDCGEGAWFRSKVEKQKEEIANTAKEIANVSNQITELERKKEGLRVNVNTATEELQRDIFGREEAKEEANKAIANFERSVNANANIDRSIEDMERVLEKLEK
jgi:chromosome segregation ATPase